MIVSGTLQSFFIFCIYFSLLLTKIDILLLTKVHTLLELSVFLINVLFLSQDLIHGYHVTFTRFLLTVTVSQRSFVFNDLDKTCILAIYFVYFSSIWIYLIFSPWFYNEHSFLDKGHRDKEPLHHISRISTVNMSDH